ncbi:MAG: DUF2244 domain-containing protein [Gammaproteobacteria bacterium]
MTKTFATECGGARFVLRPTRSLSWRQTQLLFGSTVVVTLIIAIGCAALGFWPVLPFTGLEIGALGLALWIVADRGQQLEVVDIDAERVAVRKGRRRPESQCEFKRAWTQIRLQRPRIAHYPSRLVIRSHGNEVELGSFLQEEERRELARRLARAVEQPGCSTT